MPAPAPHLRRAAPDKALSSARASQPLASRCPSSSSTHPRRSPTATASASPSPKSTASSAPATSTHRNRTTCNSTTCTPPSSPSPSAPSLRPSSGAPPKPSSRCSINPPASGCAIRNHNPRPARTLHHRRRVPPPAHPLPAHLREVAARKTHRRLHHSLRIPPRPHLRTRRRRHRASPHALPPAQPPHRAAPARPDLGRPGLNYSVSAKNQIVILSGAKNPRISPSPLTVLEPRTSNLEPATYWVPRGAFFQANRFLLPELLALVTNQSQRPISLGPLRRRRPLLPRPCRPIHPGHRRRDRRTRRHRARRRQAPQPPRRQSHYARLPPRRRPPARPPRPHRPRPAPHRSRPRGLRPARPHRRAHSGLRLLLAGNPALRSADPHHPRRTSGYTLAELHLFDLFPQTTHIETVAVLTR